MPPSPAAERRVHAWITAALALEAGKSPHVEPASEDPAALRAVLDRLRLTQVLVPHAEALPVGAEVAARLREVGDARRRAVMVEILELGRIQAAMANAGIRLLIVKGLPLAVQTTGDAAGRGIGDLDLLVAPDDVAGADRVLAELGWRQPPEIAIESGTWAWRYLQYVGYELTYLGAGTPVDLHWRLDPTLDGLPGFDELWSRRTEIELARGFTVPTLCLADAFRHSCLHAAKDVWRRSASLVDIHRLTRDPHLWKDLDGTALSRVELRTLAVTRAAFGLPDTVPAEVRTALDRQPSGPVRRTERVRLAEAGTEAAPMVETLRLLRYQLAVSATRRDVLRALVAQLMPTNQLAGIRSRTAWVGVPRALARRLGSGVTRSFGWLARSRRPAAPRATRGAS